MSGLRIVRIPVTTPNKVVEVKQLWLRPEFEHFRCCQNALEVGTGQMKLERGSLRKLYKGDDSKVLRSYAHLYVYHYRVYSIVSTCSVAQYFVNAI